MNLLAESSLLHGTSAALLRGDFPPLDSPRTSFPVLSYTPCSCVAAGLVLSLSDHLTTDITLGNSIVDSDAPQSQQIRTPVPAALANFLIEDMITSTE
jgi:hypothetical protein